MSTAPLVSIIISAYNVQEFVREAIDSIISQSYTNFELIIADDGSQDDTKRIIKTFRDHRIIFFDNENNLGLVDTWNYLLTKCQGKYIMFHDADDVAHPARISKLVSFLEQHRDVVICGSNYARIFRKWGLYYRSDFPLSYQDILTQVAEGKMPFLGKVMYRREIFDEFYAFRQYFKHKGWEDFDLILRILEKYPVANIPEVLYEYRYRSASSSKISVNADTHRLFIDKIGFFLSQQRQKYGVDCLDNNSNEEIELFLLQLKIQPSNIVMIKFERQMRNCIANKDFFNAITLWLTNFTLLALSQPRNYWKYVYLTPFAYFKTLGNHVIGKMTGNLKYSINEFN